MAMYCRTALRLSPYIPAQTLLRVAPARLLFRSFATEGEAKKNEPLDITYNDIKQREDFQYISPRDLHAKITQGGKSPALFDLREKWEVRGEPGLPGAVILSSPAPSEEYIFSGKRTSELGSSSSEQQDGDAPATKTPAPDVFREAYRLSADQWPAKYGVSKVDHDEEIVFYAGSHEDARVTSAMESARRLGFQNLYALIGGSRVWNKLGLSPQQTAEQEDDKKITK
eukprot:TRINITY_DN6948_c0_g1_i1.p1 TRINITY_DN6948_c0_g1~~TRINITY_DN6948_c0_g1_i1.p1  ORF type:complete len:227 (+),score=43.97 TRINITY_DN6948_c0_g1_i1:14-694(+)